MNPCYVICPESPSQLLEEMIQAATSGCDTHFIKDADELPDLKNKRILFAIQLGQSGFNITLSSILMALYERGPKALEGSRGAVLIHSHHELFTKSVAQDIIFLANQMGCFFPGRPLVEATGSLRNFLTMQKVIKKPLEAVCLDCCRHLGQQLLGQHPKSIDKPKILALHSSNYETSNSLRLWSMVKKHLSSLEIKEIHIENGTVRDCKGCPYTTCKHYGKQNSCFYGGIMVEEVYPAVLEADAIIWICPNYNDAISANLTAVINRLTALFRRTKFYDKYIFGIIVSGNSGSDVLSKQLISALNINKTFQLPPYFSIMATANNKDAILEIDHIKEEAKAFAENMIKQIKA